MPHKLNVAHFNTYDTPEFSVVKDVAALTEGNVGGVAASLFRKGAGVIDALGQIAGTDVNAARAITLQLVKLSIHEEKHCSLLPNSESLNLLLSLHQETKKNHLLFMILSKHLNITLIHQGQLVKVSSLISC